MKGSSGPDDLGILRAFRRLSEVKFKFDYPYNKLTKISQMTWNWTKNNNLLTFTQFISKNAFTYVPHRGILKVQVFKSCRTLCAPLFCPA